MDYFSEPTLKVLLRLSVSQIMDQNEAVIVVVENVARIAMTMGATQVTQFLLAIVIFMSEIDWGEKYVTLWGNEAIYYSLSL